MEYNQYMTEDTGYGRTRNSDKPMGRLDRIESKSTGQE